jgi:hypothetical protein
MTKPINAVTERANLRIDFTFSLHKIFPTKVRFAVQCQFQREKFVPAFARRLSVALPLDAIRRPRDTPIWKLGAALKMPIMPEGPLCPTGARIKLTETREIRRYLWVHPDEER